MLLFLKNLVFSLLVPGTIGVYLPWYLTGATQGDVNLTWGLAQILALLPLGAGLALYLACVWQFGSTGRGTPAPIDPPRHLVIRGPYRFVRNPMYLGVLLVVLGWALFFSSRDLLIYAAIVAAAFHFFVLVIEEPILRRKFGSSYAAYTANVRRWLPGPAWPDAA
jgi:protein-S-isoprenylcysteine O-methyltransferase Ste14